MAETNRCARTQAPDATSESVRVEVDYFTDPLCCWSWALEPQWRRLRFEFGGQLAYRYRMGGMISDWNSYDDPINSIGRPMQMGPLWFQVREVSGMPLDDRIWWEDPPASSYPACAAVKAAELQSNAAAEAYLRRLREAVMVKRRNTARRETLLKLADELEREGSPPFDAARFARDRNSAEVLEAFREDLRTARYMGIGRFPTLVLRRHGEAGGLMLVGYRPYETIRSAIRHLDSRIEPKRRTCDRAVYDGYWGGALERELRELATA